MVLVHLIIVHRFLPLQNRFFVLNKLKFPLKIDWYNLIQINLLGIKSKSILALVPLFNGQTLSLSLQPLTLTSVIEPCGEAHFLNKTEVIEPNCRMNKKMVNSKQYWFGIVFLGLGNKMISVEQKTSKWLEILGNRLLFKSVLYCPRHSYLILIYSL